MRIRSSVAMIAILLAACGGQNPPPAPSGDASLAPPTLVVERFLRAVNTNDLETMAQLFGTAEGSVLRRNARADVEQRMFALASLLRHEDYALTGEDIVPGRMNEAIRIVVQMQLNEEQARVPFLMVRSRDGWLVERIELDEVLAR